MLGKKVVFIAFLVSLFTVCAQAAVEHVYTDGPFSVARTGANEAEATDAALTALADIIEDYEDSLPINEKVDSVAKHFNWDGTTCTITYVIFVRVL